MAKYRKPPEDIVEEPKLFAKHYWHIASDWVVANRDNVLTGLLVVAIIILGIVVWNRYSSSRNTIAWGQVTLASKPDELEKAVASYGGTPAGRFLKILLADRYMNEGEFDRAGQLYAAMSKDLEFGERARYSHAMSREAAGKFDEAAAELRQIASGADFWATQAKTALETQEKRREAYASFEAAKAAAAAAQAAAMAASTASSLENVASTESTLQEAAQAESVETQTEAPGTSSATPQ